MKPVSNYSADMEKDYYYTQTQFVQKICLPNKNSKIVRQIAKEIKIYSKKIQNK